MSDIRANTISDAAGTGPITLTKQSAAKAWSHGGETTLNDSFNISSATDNGVGLYLYNLSSSMNNATYPIAGIATSSRLALEYEGTLSSSVYGIGVRQTDNTGFADSTISTMAHGDLA